MTRRREIQAVEGEPVKGLSPSETRDLNRAREELNGRLRPTLPLFQDTAKGVVPTNIVGTVKLNASTVIRIRPKVGQGDDWMAAALDLMVPERATFAGHRHARRGARKRSLEAGLAAIYNDRLGRALRTDGPIEVTHSEFAFSGSLDGQLDVERWLLGKSMREIAFPVQRTVLDADNEFTEALAFAAALLSRSAGGGPLRSSLSKLAQEIRPGLPAVMSVDPGIIGRPFPQQWSRYQEAWSIAQVVLDSASFSAQQGRLAGVEVALEPWKLLEELLDRSLNELVRHLRTEHVLWTNSRQEKFAILRREGIAGGPLSRLVGHRFAKPENVLTSPNGTVATFEAKYSRPGGPRAIRGHMYQAIVAAAYARSPIAVLVYPELAQPVHWRTANDRTAVRDVWAIGLDLFGYSSRVGLQERANTLRQILCPSSSSAIEPGISSATEA